MPNWVISRLALVFPGDLSFFIARHENRRSWKSEKAFSYSYSYTYSFLHLNGKSKKKVKGRKGNIIAKGLKGEDAFSIYILK